MCSNGAKLELALQIEQSSFARGKACNMRRGRKRKRVKESNVWGLEKASKASDRVKEWSHGVDEESDTQSPKVSHYIEALMGWNIKSDHKHFRGLRTVKPSLTAFQVIKNCSKLPQQLQWWLNYRIFGWVCKTGRLELHARSFRHQSFN